MGGTTAHCSYKHEDCRRLFHGEVYVRSAGCWRPAAFPRTTGDKETQDEMLSRLLKQRISELEMMDDGNDDDDDDDDVLKQLLTPPPPFKVGSYEMLSLLVSAFFAATVFLSGGTIFANAPAPTARVILDADELLRQDFARDASSVRFGVKDYELAPTSLDKTFSSWR
jgi:hypothetical protein